MIGDVKGAQEAFEQVLEIEPRHELAQIALAQQHEAAKRPAKAVDLYLELAESLPENETILLGLARSLRKLGRTRQARAVLAPMAAKPNPISQVAVEMGHIEVETGHYDRAKGWFDKGAARDMINLDTLAAAGIALAATGAMDAADRVFSWISDDLTLAASLDDLQERLAVEPENRAAAAEHQNVLRKLSTKSAEDNPYQWALAGISAGERHNSPGMQLYAQHCSVCHGANGNGNGRAARYLFPRPRNLRADSFRLVSTRNGIPTIEDIRAVIRQGIHGTSMTSASTLSDNEVDQLIDVVEQMRRDGIREQYIEMLEKDEEPIDEQELENVVRSRTTPGELVLTPAFDASTAEAVAQGGEIYIQQTCVACHGKIGAGDETLPLFDDHGFPSLPRDLRHDLFKGGSKSAAIYTRLVAGMPGTPHPASANLSDRETGRLGRLLPVAGPGTQKKLDEPSACRPSIASPARRLLCAIKQLLEFPPLCSASCSTPPHPTRKRGGSDNLMSGRPRDRQGRPDENVDGENGFKLFSVRETGICYDDHCLTRLGNVPTRQLLPSGRATREFLAVARSDSPREDAKTRDE